MIDIIKGLFEFAKTPTTKLVLILAIVSAVVGFLTWTHHQIYQAGVNSEKVRQEALHKEAMQALEQRLKVKLAKASADKDEWREKAIELESIKPVIKYEKIIEIVENENCTAFGGAFVELWNDRHQRFNSASRIIGQ